MASKPLPVFDWSATNRASVHGYDFRVVQFESTKQWALLVFHGDYITASYTYTSEKFAKQGACTTLCSLTGYSILD